MSEARDSRASDFRQGMLPDGLSRSRGRSNDLEPTTPYDVPAGSSGPAPADRRVVLSMLPADRRERVRALAVVLVSSLVFLALAPFARVPLGRVDAFIPSYQSALAVNDLITAALLFGQFATLRSRALLVLAS
jgi:hypothetical protein